MTEDNKVTVLFNIVSLGQHTHTNMYTQRPAHSIGRKELDESHTQG